MKTIKFILTLIFALTVNIVSGGGIAVASGLPVVPVIAVLIGTSLLPLSQPGVLGADIRHEIWTGELIKAFRHAATFLQEIPSYDSLVNNDVIHLVDVGADPNVLINNTTYPIPVSEVADGDITISLDKYQTEATSIPDDYLDYISFDKIGTVTESHRLALEDKTAIRAAHALAPTNENITGAPVVLTTGDRNGATNGRKRLRVADIITAKAKLDELGVPLTNRVLVLVPSHVEDLLRKDEVFKNQYQNIKTGQILQLYGFKIYEYPKTAEYYDNAGTLTKRAFGAIPVPAEDQSASLFFYSQRAFKARGRVLMYLEEPKPQYQRTLVNFKLHHVCLPKKWEGFGVLVSSKV